MKRFVFILVAITLVLALVSCQAKATPTPAPAKPAAPATVAKPGAPTPTPAAAVPAPATPTPVAAAKPAATPVPAAPAKKYEFLMGTTSTTSSHYPPGVATAKSINDNVPGVHITVVETGATHDNIQRMIKGDLDISQIVALEGAFMAYQGKMRYTKPWPEIRWWFNYSLVPVYNIVRADSGIKNITELAGKKFNAGIVGSAAETNTRITMEALGIKPDWFLGSPADAVEAVKDRRAVGYAKAPASIASLDSSTLDIQSFTQITILGYTEEQINNALKAVPGIVRVNVPAGAIKTLPNMPAFTTWGYVIGGVLPANTVPLDIAYRMTKAVIGNWKKDMVSAFPPAVDYDPVKDTIKHLSDAPIPLPFHAGVVQYFEEVGANVPDKLKPPEYKK